MNEEVVETMRGVEESFKQHSDEQIAKYTELMKQYMATTDMQLSELGQQLQDVTGRRVWSLSEDASG